MKLAPLFASVGLSLAMVGCAQYAKVYRVNPVFTPVRVTVGALVGVEHGISNALSKESRAPREALSDFLGTAQLAQEQLLRNPNDTAARSAYNFAVARVMATLDRANLDPWSKPLRVPSKTKNGDWFLLGYQFQGKQQISRLNENSWNPALYKFTPADEVEVKGAYFTACERKEGIGAPLIAKAKNDNPNAEKEFAPKRIIYGVTAVIRFRGNQAEISLIDPLAAENVTLGGHSFPLAGDYATPMGVMLAEANPRALELKRLINPAKYAETAKVVRLQPYDPNKSVVLVIHGLMDSQATWAPMINHLRADSKIREHYQFWIYSYPSGYPYPYSAAILRRELNAIERRFPLRKPIIVIGHSMGGCISRLLITDSHQKIWMDIFKKTPGQVHMSKANKKLFTESLIFNHRPEVGRVIFISSPLRGSDLASHWVGRLGSLLIMWPRELLSAGEDVIKLVTFQPGELKIKRIPNSVDTLAPNNRFMQSLQRIPIKQGIPYHVICGDRGKGGHKDKTPPVMSDGVVPYWSSHLEGALSEEIVHCNHSAHQNPAAMAEVERILKRYAN